MKLRAEWPDECAGHCYYLPRTWKKRRLDQGIRFVNWALALSVCSVVSPEWLCSLRTQVIYIHAHLLALHFGSLLA